MYYLTAEDYDVYFKSEDINLLAAFAVANSTELGSWMITDSAWNDESEYKLLTATCDAVKN